MTMDTPCNYCDAGLLPEHLERTSIVPGDLG